MKKLNLHWFCTQNHILSLFRSDVHIQKLRNFGTVPPGVANLVSKCAGNLKENCHKVSWQELCALQSYRAKCQGGHDQGGPSCPPPSPVLLGLKLINSTSEKHNNNNNNNNNWFLYSAFLVWDTTQSALQCIITPVTGFIINPALIVHLLNSLGSILARCYFRGAHMPHHATNNVRILPGTHLYTWVEMNICYLICFVMKQEYQIRCHI